MDMDYDEKPIVDVKLDSEKSEYVVQVFHFIIFKHLLA